MADMQAADLAGRRLISLANQFFSETAIQIRCDDKVALFLGGGCNSMHYMYVRCWCPECHHKPALLMEGADEDVHESAQAAVEHDRMVIAQTCIMSLVQFMQHCRPGLLSPNINIGDVEKLVREHLFVIDPTQNSQGQPHKPVYLDHAMQFWGYHMGADRATGIAVMVIDYMKDENDPDRYQAYTLGEYNPATGCHRVDENLEIHLRLNYVHVCQNDSPTLIPTSVNEIQRYSHTPLEYIPDYVYNRNLDNELQSLPDCGRTWAPVPQPQQQPQHFAFPPEPQPYQLPAVPAQHLYSGQPTSNFMGPPQGQSPYPGQVAPPLDPGYYAPPLPHPEPMQAEAASRLLQRMGGNPAPSQPLPPGPGALYGQPGAAYAPPPGSIPPYGAPLADAIYPGAPPPGAAYSGAPSAHMHSGGYPQAAGPGGGFVATGMQQMPGMGPMDGMPYAQQQHQQQHQHYPQQQHRPPTHQQQQHQQHQQPQQPQSQQPHQPPQQLQQQPQDQPWPQAEGPGDTSTVGPHTDTQGVVSSADQRVEIKQEVVPSGPAPGISQPGTATGTPFGSPAVQPVARASGAAVPNDLPLLQTQATARSHVVLPLATEPLTLGYAETRQGQLAAHHFGNFPPAHDSVGGTVPPPAAPAAALSSGSAAHPPVEHVVMQPLTHSAARLATLEAKRERLSGTGAGRHPTPPILPTGPRFDHPMLGAASGAVPIEMAASDRRRLALERRKEGDRLSNGSTPPTGAAPAGNGPLSPTGSSRRAELEARLRQAASGSAPSTPPHPEQVVFSAGAAALAGAATPLAGWIPRSQCSTSPSRKPPPHAGTTPGQPAPPIGNGLAAPWLVDLQSITALHGDPIKASQAVSDLGMQAMETLGLDEETLELAEFSWMALGPGKEAFTEAYTMLRQTVCSNNGQFVVEGNMANINKWLCDLITKALSEGEPRLGGRSHELQALQQRLTKIKRGIDT